MAPAVAQLCVTLPRALLDPCRQDLPPGDADGLLPVQLKLAEGRVQQILPAPQAEGAPLALTPLVDAHVHLDKCFSWAAHPNRSGSMAGALAANGQEAGHRSVEQVLERGERALDQAWRYGLRALRSHVDSGGAACQASWESLLALQHRWRGRVELQLVALVPLAHWSTPDGVALARRVAENGGLLGGVLGPPFSTSRSDPQQLRTLLELAGELGTGIDLHVDEGGDSAGRGVGLLLDQLDQLKPGSRGVPITCSHGSSQKLLAERAQRQLADRLAGHGVAVVALPSTNFWLLGRRHGLTSPLRPVAPLRVLQQAGVAVALGGDNVQDPWFPGGDFDPLELLRLAVPLLHLAPWSRQGLMPFTSVPARLLGLPWDGVVREGCPADLVLLAASSWAELLARSPQRRVLRAGAWLPPAPGQQPDPRLASVGA
jgi:cytosine deaminase